jgi:hypothetical protein
MARRADIAVFVTEEAYNTDSAIDEKVKKYISDAFESIKYDIGLVATNHKPDPPTEDASNNTPITDTVCGTDQREYNDLLEWWYDYHRCNNLLDAADSNLLVTDSTNLAGEGYVGGKIAVASGHQIKNINLGASVPYRATGTKHYAMATALHEIGHNLGCVHKDGYHEVVNNGSEYNQTLMMHDYSEKHDYSNNNCSNYLNNVDDTMDKYVKYEFSVPHKAG